MADRTRIVIALDFNDLDQALRVVEITKGQVDFYKIGSVLFTSVGPRSVEEVMARGKKVFLDLKFHDIPNTVSGAARGAAAMGVYMLTVHCSGGAEMVRAAREGAEAGGRGGAAARPKVIGVTVLTSLAGSGDTSQTVLKLSREAATAGADGVVCSPLEVGQVKRAWGAKMLAVVPGIRLAEDLKDDQARVGTPGRAAADGADFIVVGRSVTGSSDPGKTLATVLREIAVAGR